MVQDNTIWGQSFEVTFSSYTWLHFMPIKGLRILCRLIPASQDSSAFCIPFYKYVMHITYSQVNNRLKCLMKKATIGTKTSKRRGFLGGPSWCFRLFNTAPRELLGL